MEKVIEKVKRVKNINKGRNNEIENKEIIGMINRIKILFFKMINEVDIFVIKWNNVKWEKMYINKLKFFEF